MAFRCEVCTKAQPAGTQPTKLVTETREKHYMSGGNGREIVKELNACDSCAAEIQQGAA